MLSRRGTPSSKAKGNKALIRRTRTSTAPRISSGCHRRPAGHISRPRQSNLPLGQLVDEAMARIERDNPALKDVLPKDYARAALDKQRLGQIIDLISNIQVGDADPGRLRPCRRADRPARRGGGDAGRGNAASRTRGGGKLLADRRLANGAHCGTIRAGMVGAAR